MPSVTRNPSHSTYSPAGGRIGFNVTLTYPVGSIPSFQVKPPGADWLFVGVGGPDLPLTPNLPGDSTNPAAYDSGFDFY